MIDISHMGFPQPVIYTEDNETNVTNLANICDKRNL